MPSPSPVSSWPKQPPSLKLVKDLYQLGYNQIVGVDEVGRGALAGPLVVAAVQLDEPIIGINDSKLIPVQRRCILAEQIHRLATQISFGASSNEEIDQLGLSGALSLAYSRALVFIDADLVLTDNYHLPDLRYCKAVKGDQLFYPTAAASIVAKVHRDQLMRVYHQAWPQYAWDQNVGYATQNHKEAIKKSGLVALHRKSFRLK